ncbi:MAG TPA: hypothetical protein VGM78_08110 [Ilumatobacteraceae bacterium]
MSGFDIVRPEDRVTRGGREVIPEHRQPLFSPGELDSRISYCFPRRPGTDGTRGLELFEAHFDPDTVVESHAHTQDEVLFVTAGELIAGAQHCGPGTAIYIEANTLYGFRTGPDGCSFLNFHPSGSAFLTRSAWSEQRDAARTTQEQ